MKNICYFFVLIVINISILPAYEYNSDVQPEVWEQLEPFFLPSKHPAKAKLDKIFKRKRVVASRDSLIQAGFNINSPMHPENLLVGSHPKLKGYLIKTYIDSQDVCEWENFSRRIRGSNAIKENIVKHNFQKYFKVPHKWIYPLPINRGYLPGPNVYRKNFILVVEDMNILSHHKNKKAYLQIKKPMLDALYTVITEAGLIDSVFRGNVPFNAYEQMNFIDTEHFNLLPIPYHMLNRYLSPEMQTYWKSITDQP